MLANENIRLDTHAALAKAPLDSVRRSIRTGRYRRHTAGLAQGHLQCNLVILPASEAETFATFCARNPQACPVVGTSEAGSWSFPDLGSDIDLRTDVPQYNIYRHGVLSDTVDDLSHLWRDDFVAFALGCSFTFERALMDAGIPMRHVAEDKTVPMFVSNRDTVPAPPFGGKMVVSMRPIRAGEVERARALSARYPLAHGAPVHAGDPVAIGVSDLMATDWGDPVAVEVDEVPVFWACGVTPQVALQNARPALCITHAPGSMLITDLDEFHAAKAPIGAHQTSNQESPL